MLLKRMIKNKQTKNIGLNSVYTKFSFTVLTEVNPWTLPVLWSV